MAEHLARIFGSEEDRVNCPFYFKMGACRNGDWDSLSESGEFLRAYVRDATRT